MGERIDNVDGRLNHMIGPFCHLLWRKTPASEIRSYARDFIDKAFNREATEEEVEFALQCADDAVRAEQVDPHTGDLTDPRD